MAELRLALAGLREQIRGRRSPDPLVSAASLPDGEDLFALFDELRRRMANVGMSEHSGESDEFGMDFDLLIRAEPLLEFLRERYWRVEVSGRHWIPERGPCLFVANQSGLLPYDGCMLSHILGRGQELAARPKFLVGDWLITLPFMQAFLARIGAVRDCSENLGRLLSLGRRVVAFPEGMAGATKLYDQRYRLQDFGSSPAIRVAAEAGVPIVPVGIVGAEEAQPLLSRQSGLGRALGLPLLPLTPTFPLLGPLGLLPLPSRWRILFGEPLEFASREGDGEGERAGPGWELAAGTEAIRLRIGELIAEGRIGHSADPA
jgi:1-acyl-sn-glycerol-3-phosphate acyltransferase